MFRLSRIRKFGADRKGTGTLEFVMTMPLFLAALAFAFEFGQILLAHQSLVNNVRSAARYLSRSDMSGGSISNAVRMVRTGRLTFGGITPEYLDTDHATVTVTPTYSTFSPPNFRETGRTMRIVVSVNYPLAIFGFVEVGDRPSVPFVVAEDLRYVGS